MDGCWPSSFFSVDLHFWVHENSKTEQGQYPAVLTEQGWLKDLLHVYYMASNTEG